MFPQLSRLYKVHLYTVVKSLDVFNPHLVKNPYDQWSVLPVGISLAEWGSKMLLSKGAVCPRSVCMCVLCGHMCRFLQRPEAAVRSLRTGVKGGCEPNLELLEEQQTFLNAKPFFPPWESSLLSVSEILVRLIISLIVWKAIK